MRKRQLGFGLGFGGSFSDRVVVPAVIFAILAVVAIPSFVNYRVLSRVSNELAEVGAPAKAAIEKAFITRGPADMSRRSNTGWMRPGFRQYLQSADIAKDGTITLRFTGEVAPQAENQIQIVPVSGGKPLDLSQAANPASSSNGSAAERRARAHCRRSSGRRRVAPAALRSEAARRSRRFVKSLHVREIRPRLGRPLSPIGVKKQGVVADTLHTLRHSFPRIARSRFRGECGNGTAVVPFRVPALRRADGDVAPSAALPEV